VATSDFPRLFEAQYASFTQDLPFWLSLAGSQGGPILELGCGPGRVLVALARKGFAVDGLDRDPEMLRRAERCLSEEPKGRIHLIEGDLREFSLDQRYRLVLLPCNTFAHLERSAAEGALACIRRHLLPGGAFAAELPSRYDAFGATVDPDEPLDTFLEPEHATAVQVYAEQQSEPERGLVRVAWRYDELRADGRVDRTEIDLAYHIWDPSSLQAAVQRAGFPTLVSYGDYDRSPYRPDSPRLLVVAHT
jgi:SAM-dependent methyltransferase